MPLAAIPTRYVVGGYPARCSEVATYVHVAATDRQRPDKKSIATTHTTPQGIPLATIPSRYATSSHATRRIEEATYVHVVPTDRYCVDSHICTRQVKSIVPILIAWDRSMGRARLYPWSRLPVLLPSQRTCLT